MIKRMSKSECVYEGAPLLTCDEKDGARRKWLGYAEPRRTSESLERVAGILATAVSTAHLTLRRAERTGRMIRAPVFWMQCSAANRYGSPLRARFCSALGLALG
jgi:hypothetical protein